MTVTQNVSNSDPDPDSGLHPDSIEFVDPVLD
jgi:hypothetical protein